MAVGWTWANVRSSVDSLRPLTLAATSIDEVGSDVQCAICTGNGFWDKDLMGVGVAEVCLPILTYSTRLDSDIKVGISVCTYSCINRI